MDYVEKDISKEEARCLKSVSQPNGRHSIKKPITNRT